MKIDNQKSAPLKKQMESEIQQYLTETVSISEDHDFSQAKLVRRISLFENKIYPTGKFDKQGNYKYWFDIINPGIDSEVKNVDFDTKDIDIYSPRKNDALPCIITNLRVAEYLRVTGQAEEINSAIEEGAGWGNILWKKVKGGYERCDLKNIYVINQTASCVNETPIIERHQFGSSDLRAKMAVWDNVKEVLENCKSDTYKTTIGTQERETTVPYYDMYERNGEVSVWDLKEAQGDTSAKDTDKEKYVLAKIIGAGTKGTVSGVSIEFIVYAEELKGKEMEDLYKEYHRGRYKGRWFREGLYELCFDIQVRANQVGNQLAQGLEYVAKQLFYSPDKLIMQNLITDLKNGDIIKASQLAHVPVRIDGFDQLVNEWNRLLEMRNEICNSREIVTGDSTPGQPFRLGALLNQNANKLFDFIREKLSIPFSQMFEQWIVPELIKDLRTQDILRLTGDSDMIDRLCMLCVDNWYLNNLYALPPHTNDQAMVFKQEELKKLKSRPDLLMKGVKDVFDDFKPSVSVIITGEQLALDNKLQTIGTFVSLEMDPVRRTALIELMMKEKGIDAGSLPKSPAGSLGPVQQNNGQGSAQGGGGGGGQQTQPVQQQQRPQFVKK